MILLEIYIVVVSVFLIYAIFFLIAHRRIKKNAIEIFNSSRPGSVAFQKKCDMLMQRYQTYLEYIDYLGLNRIHDCSSSIVDSASKSPVKYVIKYSNVEKSRECLERVDFCRRYLSSLETLEPDMKRVYDLVKGQIGFFGRILISKYVVVFTVCDVDRKLLKIEPTKFEFRYISPAKKSQMHHSVKITSTLLRDIESEISASITKSGHTRTQRSAMTNDLREAIKQRDNYTCCQCGNSVFKEPNLLLEVDHIIPVSKGGKTEANNLQTLCWRCNRAKGDSL